MLPHVSLPLKPDGSTVVRRPAALGRPAARSRRRSATYSTDDGRSFRSLGDPIVFDPPLPETVLVGLATTGHSPPRITETRFSGLELPNPYPFSHPGPTRNCIPH